MAKSWSRWPRRPSVAHVAERSLIRPCKVLNLVLPRASRSLRLWTPPLLNAIPLLGTVALLKECLIQLALQ